LLVELKDFEKMGGEPRKIVAAWEIELEEFIMSVYQKFGCEVVKLGNIQI
jgi:selenophosphate synthetase-related protein